MVPIHSMNIKMRNIILPNMTQKKDGNELRGVIVSMRMEL